MNFFHKTQCRICLSSNLIKILDFGLMPLSNAFLKKEELDKPEKKFPLVVYFCKNCGLLQLSDIVNPELLFKQYYYLTSTSLPLAEHFVEMGKKILDRFVKSSNDLVIDVGGNDVVMLSSIKDKCRVLNVEPATNIAEISKNKGVETINDFFNKKTAEKILKEKGPAKVITASNVFAHIDNLKEVIEGVKLLMEEKGIFIIEVHWVANLLGLVGIGGFDQIYHEHLSYFSLSALKVLFNRLGLNIFDVKLIPIHGQSLQIYVTRNGNSSRAVQKILEKEKELALDQEQTYFDFAKRVRQNREKLLNILLNLKKENKKIVGYGAPAKGNILLNYCDIDNKILDFIIDDSQLKQGLYTPGTHIPIYSSSKLKDEQPDYLLLLAWNYAESILQKEQKLRDIGVKFIIPVSKVKIV